MIFDIGKSYYRTVYTPKYDRIILIIYKNLLRCGNDGLYFQYLRSIHKYPDELIKASNNMNFILNKPDIAINEASLKDLKEFKFWDLIKDYNKLKRKLLIKDIIE